MTGARQVPVTLLTVAGLDMVGIYVVTVTEKWVTNEQGQPR